MVVRKSKRRDCERAQVFVKKQFRRSASFTKDDDVNFNHGDHYSHDHNYQDDSYNGDNKIPVDEVNC